MSKITISSAVCHQHATITELFCQIQTKMIWNQVSINSNRKLSIECRWALCFISSSGLPRAKTKLQFGFRSDKLPSWHTVREQQTTKWRYVDVVQRWRDPSGDCGIITHLHDKCDRERIKTLQFGAAYIQYWLASDSSTRGQRWRWSTITKRQVYLQLAIKNRADNSALIKHATHDNPDCTTYVTTM